MDSATFHVLSNVKIITTALLYRAILHRALSSRRWLSLTILFLGSIVNALSSLEYEGRGWDPSHLHVTVWGLFVMLLYCLISGFAGVYTERIMRQRMHASMFAA